MWPPSRADDPVVESSSDLLFLDIFAHARAVLGSSYDNLFLVCDLLKLDVAWFLPRPVLPARRRGSCET